MKEELEEFKRKIIAYAKEIGEKEWFYPSEEGVMGFDGTQDIILLGLNPSSGEFKDNDRKLYGLLKEKGFVDIHITDFIRLKAKNKEVKKRFIGNEKLMKEQVAFFKEELSIIKPKIIIALGVDCYKLLNKYFPEMFLDNSPCKVIKILHYGQSAYRKSEKVFKEISAQLDKIKEKYKILCKK